jgi:hypothetical protein
MSVAVIFVDFALVLVNKSLKPKIDETFNNGLEYFKATMVTFDVA